MSHLEHSQRPDAVLLLGRGGTGAAARQGLAQLAQALQAQLPQGCEVQLAFVDKASPSLPQALDACVQAGARRIVVLPVWVPGEAALQRWLDKCMLRWRAAKASTSTDLPRIVVAEPLQGMAGLPALLAQQALNAWPGQDVAERVDGAWQHDPAAWSQVPAHTQHVLVCTGPRCTALGAVDVWDSLSAGRQADAALRARCMLLQTSCQYPCNHGPVAIIYPEGVWYGGLSPQNVLPLVRTHVLDGQVDTAHRVHGPGPTP